MKWRLPLVSVVATGMALLGWYLMLQKWGIQRPVPRPGSQTLGSFIPATYVWVALISNGLWLITAVAIWYRGLPFVAALTVGLASPFLGGGVAGGYFGIAFILDCWYIAVPIGLGTAILVFVTARNWTASHGGKA